MISPINSVGITPNGNVYKKSRTFSNIGMAIGGISTALCKGINTYSVYKEAAKADKKAVIAAGAVFGLLSVGASLLWGKLIGGFIDDRVNLERMTDVDGMEVRMAKINAQKQEELQNIQEEILQSEVDCCDEELEACDGENCDEVDEITEETIDEPSFDETVLDEEISEEEV